MEHSNFLVEAVIFMAAAVIAVPIATRLGLGSVLGYLLAGVAIGPSALGLVGDASDEMHVAEFGVALMLFLIGLELQPKKLWQMRGAILGTGSAQLLLTAAAVAGVALLLFGLDWRSAVAIGLILALSSTAIVLQSLSEKGLLKTQGGRSAFAVLLFQDIAVIPILALLPLLAGTPAEAHASGLSGWQYAAAVIGTIAAFAISGRYLLGPLLRLVAGSQVREMFTVTALLIVFAAAAVMTWLDLSPALGTFLAGVLLAESEFRHELEADIQPFKGLLLGLFFIAVGASLNFAQIAENPLLLFGLVITLVLVKFAVLFGLARMMRLSKGEDWLFALSLAQAGEFGFVLVSFSTQIQVLDAGASSLLVALIALTMALTPVLLLIFEQFIQPRFLVGPESPVEVDTPHQ
ncbi:monovalent cation:proton antiporter-2 (CPA2) family protein [Microbulbifer sp. MLAF003]|uniref:monovalent cation:proton antiporter-2 (CPA2) family protein n=1 Tax=Microbulbifer sp. MLAF003 TaxID=3032582 RepID=UPI0024AD1794|nr:monovalent cation:proton antiporter-2 (CPA2) family protein [Microbulbifer sp. MLAF003]WHI51288.1 monovalent cation:proton antiporter-2 (CPA2) family protein [Microbulbifer sp. MLAF003]